MNRFSFPLLFLLGLLCVFLVWACQNSARPGSPIPAAANPIPIIICPNDNVQYGLDSIPANLISANNREDVCGNWFPRDTVTPQGNYVKYLISNDSCCLSNLYVEWGNGHFKQLQCLDDLRLFHPKVYPQWWLESPDYLFLGSAASSGLPVSGWNLSLYPLKTRQEVKTYELIDPDAFDLQSMTLLREVESPTVTRLLEAYNIKTGRTKPIHFRHRLDPDDYMGSIDSLSITAQVIFIRLEIDRENGSEQEIVRLKNDIW